MANRIVLKALAGLEDLLLGTGSVNQTRNGVTTPITKIDAKGLIYENAETLRTRFGKKVEVVTNIAALQAIATTIAAEVYVYALGYTTAGDGGGGLFWLDKTDTTTTEDLNIVFNPDVIANGRWKRVDTDNYMSPDRGDADYTIAGFDFGIQLYGTTLTANRTVTLPTTGLYKGKRVSVLRTALGSFNLLIGSIATLTGKGLVELQYDGSAWIILTEPNTSDASASGDTFNGSFEIDSNNDNKPDNWTITELAGATVELDTSDSVHGVNSLKFLSGGNGGGSATSEKFNVVKGSTIGVKFNYYSNAVGSLNKVELKTYDSSNTLISTLSVFSEGSASASSYTEELWPVTVDANAVKAEITLTGIDAASTTKTAGTVTHFDNVEVVLHGEITLSQPLQVIYHDALANSAVTVLDLTTVTKNGIKAKTAKFSHTASMRDTSSSGYCGKHLSVADTAVSAGSWNDRKLYTGGLYDTGYQYSTGEWDVSLLNGTLEYYIGYFAGGTAGTRSALVAVYVTGYSW